MQNFSLQLPKIKALLEKIVSQYNTIKKKSTLSESSSDASTPQITQNSHEKDSNLYFHIDESNKSKITFLLFNSQGILICTAGAQGLKLDNVRILAGVLSHMIINQQSIGDQLTKIKHQKSQDSFHSHDRPRRNTGGSGDYFKDEECNRMKSMKMFYEFTNKYVALETFYQKPVQQEVTNPKAIIQSHKQYSTLAIIADSCYFNRGELSAISSKVVPLLKPMLSKGLITHPR